jgi:hypothetical protein
LIHEEYLPSAARSRFLRPSEEWSSLASPQQKARCRKQPVAFRHWLPETGQSNAALGSLLLSLIQALHQARFLTRCGILVDDPLLRSSIQRTDRLLSRQLGFIHLTRGNEPTGLFEKSPGPRAMDLIHLSPPRRCPHLLDCRFVVRQGCTTPFMI